MVSGSRHSLGSTLMVLTSSTNEVSTTGDSYNNLNIREWGCGALGDLPLRVGDREGNFEGVVVGVRSINQPERPQVSSVSTS